MGKASRAKRERKQQPVVIRAGLASATSSTGPEQEIKESN
jgi:hypothetical protein